MANAMGDGSTAIPTMYRGTRFRSRLEATWAAFFDLVEWPWLYEPIDLDGYIPDFILWERLLVEVKPALSLAELQEHDAREKVARSGWSGEALIVGARAPMVAEGETFAACPVIGLLREHEDDLDGWRWGAAEMFTCMACDRLSVLHADLSWRCRRCNAYEGDAYVAGIAAGRVERLWGHARATTQWVPAGRRIT